MGWVARSGGLRLATGHSPVVFGVGFTVLTFLPASNFLRPIGTIMGERLFYLPSAGLCLLVGAGDLDGDTNVSFMRPHRGPWGLSAAGGLCTVARDHTGQCYFAERQDVRRRKPPGRAKGASKPRETTAERGGGP